MNWTTLYISGRSDFRKDVREKLEGSRLQIMPGYIETTGAGTHDLYWMDEKIPLKKFKEAVGSKLIWKYRLRFHTNLEDFLQAVDQSPFSSDFSEEENELLLAMRKSA